MFEVSFLNAQGEYQRHVIKAHWLARQIARQAISNHATNIRVLLIRVDLLAVNTQTGDAHVIYEKLTPTKAALLSRDWACKNRAIGIIMWPSEQTIPRKLIVKRTG